MAELQTAFSAPDPHKFNVNVRIVRTPPYTRIYLTRAYTADDDVIVIDTLGSIDTAVNEFISKLRETQSNVSTFIMHYNNITMLADEAPVNNAFQSEGDTIIISTNAQADEISVEILRGLVQLAEAKENALDNYRDAPRRSESISGGSKTTRTRTKGKSTSKMTVPELKNACRARGLPVGGTKPELQARLTSRRRK